jgi:hypothetical protein
LTGHAIQSVAFVRSVELPQFCLKDPHMKKLLSVMLLSGLAIGAQSQDQEPAHAASGVTYGAGTSANAAIPVQDMNAKMKAGKFEGKTSGKVLSVCQTKGCWMKVENPGGEPIMVKFKDYGFFMPKDIVGKQVVLDGEAVVKETSVQQLRHYAQDAGKSKEEIEKITSPKKETVFTAKGVLVI